MKDFWGVSRGDVSSILEQDKDLQKRLCRINTFHSLGIGGGMAYRGWSKNDIDLIPKVTRSFLKKSKREQWNILSRICNELPDDINGLPVDKSFFEVVDEYGFLISYGIISREGIELVDSASNLPDDLIMKEGQGDYIESIEVFRCK